LKSETNGAEKLPGVGNHSISRFILLWEPKHAGEIAYVEMDIFSFTTRPSIEYKYKDDPQHE